MAGAGLMEESWLDHCELSLEMRGVNLASVMAGWRRAIVWTLEMVGSDRRVERM